MSDNGSGFTSVEFQQFLAANGIKQVLTSPYHPSSNGLAERAVQTFKNAVTKLDGPMEVRLSKFLFKYRITPQTTTGLSPAQLLMGRRLRTHLDLLHPDTAARMNDKQEKSIPGRAPRQFEVGEKVYAKNFHGPKWITGRIVKVTGPVSYQIETDEGLLLRRHVDQLRRQYADETSESDTQLPSCIDDEWVGQDGFSGNFPTPVILGRPNPSTDGTAPIRHSTRSRPPVDRYSPSRYT